MVDEMPECVDEQRKAVDRFGKLVEVLYALALGPGWRSACQLQVVRSQLQKLNTTERNYRERVGAAGVAGLGQKRGFALSNKVAERGVQHPDCVSLVPFGFP